MKPKRQHTKYLIGNWKANKTTEEALSWMNIIKNNSPQIHRDLVVVICPAYIHLSLFKEKLSNQTVGCQDISPYGDGAYTGEITARMLENLVDYVILGHSERYRYFSESVSLVALKANQAVDYHLTPIIALDDNNWKRQLYAINKSVIKKSILMYEPPEAISQQVGPIGKGEAAPLEKVCQMIEKIKNESESKAVIYGGSIKSGNISEFLKEDMIDGVLPGSASLNAEEWIKMIETSNQILNSMNSLDE